MNMSMTRVQTEIKPLSFSFSTEIKMPVLQVTHSAVTQLLRDFTAVKLELNQKNIIMYSLCLIS